MKREQEKAMLSFRDVRVWVGSESGRQILHGVSGNVHAGELTMLMGASGGGKTTLFSVLSGRSGGEGLMSRGTILFEGSRYDGVRHGEVGAFVTQDTVFHPDLSVEETLVSRLRLSSRGMTDEERRSRVESVMEDMRLVPIRDRQVGSLDADEGGLSLAQRKRLAVASALLVDPQVLFCDEPSTGLSSKRARELILALKDVAANRGIVVFCTIHQPSAFILDVFDRALVMAKGHIAYRGRVSSLVHHFGGIGFKCGSDVNPADFVLNLLEEEETRDEVVAGCPPPREYDQAGDGSNSSLWSSEGRAGGSGQRSRQPAGFLSTVWELTRRSIKITLRNPQGVQANVFQDVVVGILVGLLFSLELNQAGAEDRPGLIFLSITNVIFLAVQGTTLVTILERAVVLAEMAEGFYGPWTYVLSKILTQLPFQLLYTVLYVTPQYFMSGLRTDSAGPFLIHFLAHLLIALVGSAIGTMLSTLTSEPAVVNGIASPVLVVFMMFSGYLLSPTTIPVWLSWMQYLSPLRYAFLASLRVECKDLVFTCTSQEQIGPGLCPIPTGDALIERYTTDTHVTGIWEGIFVLVGMYVLFIILPALILMGTLRKMRKSGTDH